MIHLDTSFLIRALVVSSPEDLALRSWLRQGEDLAMSTIAWAEFLCGPITGELLEAVYVLVPDRLPFQDRDAVLAAELFNAGGRRRGSLADCMIASAALGSKARIATANPEDFRRFDRAGLDVIDFEK